MAKRSNPKRSYPRMVRVNELLREVLADAVRDIDDERLTDVAITSVVCEADLANAVVHYDVLDGPEADDQVLEAFDELRARLQKVINRETRLKQTPKLTFEPDPVVRSAARIDDVLRGLHADPPGETRGAGPDSAERSADEA
ncbi:30S ribosome-binding factor RbfA [Iamia sp.]|uniref:30S ribosome-binding factor RbfA n=1 Tax=Iamia sp. TaxID=2722710 RepID=UPI002C04F9B0|nr:30S ribosome-binding factor RbfA [Iamia sp.]HXH56902.1 30S ribosome-binding factor RbfA [Iamia sp.]